MRLKQIWSWVAFFAISFPAIGQRHYLCYYATQRPVIDGTGNEAVWQQAPWTEEFVDIEGDIRHRPSFRTRTKMLWDAAYLYIYAELEEPDLWGTLRQHDTVIYDDNDFEIFINPDNTTHRYFELEINTLGTVMDLFMDKPYRNGGKALLSWDTQGLQSAVQTKGTLNHPGDVDQGWMVEMAIPLKSLSFWGDGPVQDGSQWRINFSRVEWDRDVRDRQYVPRVRPGTQHRLPEHNWVWSPQGIIDMHAPEKWGYLQFSSHGGGSDTVAFVPPADEEARELLWHVYDVEKKYFRAEGHYTASLIGSFGFHTVRGRTVRPGELAIEVDATGNDYSFGLEALSTQFKATITGGDRVGTLTIDQDGDVKHRQ
jgi:hypothetical protein